MKPDEDPQTSVPGWITGVLTLVFIALAIALVAPITPSKTGSTWSPANAIWTDPTYLEKVVASFVTVNVMIIVIGLVAWVALKLFPPGRNEP